MAISDTLNSISANFSAAYATAKTKANVAVAFMQTKAEEAYENAPTTTSEAFFGTKRLAAKGLVTLAGIIAGVVSVILVSYFLLHALIQKTLLAWLAGVTLGTVVNKMRSKDEKQEKRYDLVRFTLEYSQSAVEVVCAGFKMASPIVFSAGNVAGETLMEAALNSADSACTYAANTTYNTVSSAVTEAYNGATFENACYAASFVGTTLYDGAAATASLAGSVAEGVYEYIRPTSKI